MLEGGLPGGVSYQNLRGFQGLFHQRIDVQTSFRCFDLFESGFGFRMFRNEQGATVLVRLYRDFISADPSRLGDDFDFVFANQWTQNRHRHGPRDDVDVFNGLRCDLTHAVAGDEDTSALPASDLFGEAHHVPAIEHHTRIRRCFHHDLPLNVGKGYQVDL